MPKVESGERRHRQEELVMPTQEWGLARVKEGGGGGGLTCSESGLRVKDRT